MSADLAARLRQLAHDHHDGRLDIKAYRSLRAPLLDTLVGGPTVVPLEITQPLRRDPHRWSRPNDAHFLSLSLSRSSGS